MKKIQHPALVKFIKQVNLLGGPQLPVNPPDMNREEIGQLEKHVESTIAWQPIAQGTPKQLRENKKFLKDVICELAALKRMLTGGKSAAHLSKALSKPIGELNQNFDRLALRDYAENPQDWVDFLQDSANMKYRRQAHFWTGAQKETRAAILKSAAALTTKELQRAND